MAKRRHRTRAGNEEMSEGFPVSLRFDGLLTERGEISASQLAASLQGWERMFQLGYYTYGRSSLELPDARTNLRLDFRVRRVGRGSFLVDAAIYIADAAVTGVVGGTALAAVYGTFVWTKAVIASHVSAKRDCKDLDGAVNAIEDVARKHDVRVSRNREKTEDFVTSVDGALANGTVPLDSSAARLLLSLKGQPVDIQLDQSDRAVIRTPFLPPSFDIDAEPLIEAPVRFVRINKKTGTGLFYFLRPLDESQLGQQRFHCEDKSIRRRANPYTGSFHTDEPIKVQLQRKAYEKSRHGHYWLIVGPSVPCETDDNALFPDN